MWTNELAWPLGQKEHLLGGTVKHFAFKLSGEKRKASERAPFFLVRKTTVNFF